MLKATKIPKCEDLRSHTMVIQNPPSYSYQPVINTPTTESSSGEGFPDLYKDAEWHEYELKRFKIEKAEERKRVALRQAYIWAMTATLSGAALGIVYIVST